METLKLLLKWLEHNLAQQRLDSSLLDPQIYAEISVSLKNGQIDYKTKNLQLSYQSHRYF